MATYNLISRNEFPSTSPQRMGKTDVAYVYMDESMHTIMITLPSEEDSPEAVEKKLRERIAAASTAGPKQISV